MTAHPRNRHLTDSSTVFEHSCWDSFSWSEEKHREAQNIIQQQQANPVPSKQQEALLSKPAYYWNAFYSNNQTKFFKDRHWFASEFPELFNLPSQTARTNCKNESNDTDNTEHQSQQENGSLAMADSSDEKMSDCPVQSIDASGPMILQRKPSVTVLEVGCGVGNSIFPLLEENPHISCCYGIDYSDQAISLIKANPAFDRHQSRCCLAVHDITKAIPSDFIADGSIDFVTLVFVLSAIPASSYGQVFSHLWRVVSPGGMLFYRDYARYDMTQLRFKAGRHIQEDLYARGDGTLVNFSSLDEIIAVAKYVGFEVVHAELDKRLMVNRKRQLEMHRLWNQAKFRKPL